MFKRKSVLLVAAFALLLPLAAQAVQPWTGAAGVATIDEQSLSIYDTLGTALKYNSSGSTNPINAYYNVTDTSGTGNPPWTTLELNYFDNSPSSLVKAWLIQLNPSTGFESTLMTCSSTDASLLTKRQCSIGSSINFNAGYIYIVQVTISRSSTAVDPWFYGVRLF